MKIKSTKNVQLENKKRSVMWSAEIYNNDNNKLLRTRYTPDRSDI